MDATTHPRKRTLKLIVLSLEELREDWKHAAKSLYVAVRADSITSYATGTAADGGSQSWNERLVVERDTIGEGRGLEKLDPTRRPPPEKDDSDGHPQQHRLLWPGLSSPQAFANQIRFRDFNKCPWGGYVGEICDSVNHRRAWLATIHTAYEASGAFDAAAPTTPPGLSFAAPKPSPISPLPARSGPSTTRPLVLHHAAAAKPHPLLSCLTPRPSSMPLSPTHTGTSVP
ncbi:hypothetical protein Fmac_032035 [Flemingia macrophylla]|uniref:AP2/ERF domain-containing protein n=1 Tax=Flemingia macrophylla TaxID=520843 RepID=A0ABD1L3R5_9FABA